MNTRSIAILAVAVAALFTAAAPGYLLGQPTTSAMTAMSAPGSITVPPVKGYYQGQEIQFIHTEASDEKVAQMLTNMMRSPVIVVPRLAQVPDAILVDVFVFSNGVKGGGPFGFQPDVFDSSPQDANYSPLRRLNLVGWKTGQAARELRSVQEIQEAESKGELTISRPGVVVNMPLLTWPGGRR